jgi:hypothetical protein
MVEYANVCGTLTKDRMLRPTLRREAAGGPGGVGGDGLRP